MNLKLKRAPGVYLVGFMGSGKTTVGRHLARRLGWNFFDLDDEIESAEKAAITELFAARGEAEFRRLETEMLRRHVAWIERGRPAVVALGGGAFAQFENRDLLSDRGLSVWLDCPFETVSRRVAAASHRPLARDSAQFAALYHARLDAYRLADVRVTVESDDPESTVDAILSDPQFR
jgi:shikimate kinase